MASNLVRAVARRLCAALCLSALSMLVAPTASAGIREIKPNEPVVLKGDETLLVAIVDSDTYLSGVGLQKTDGGMFKGKMLRDIRVGRNFFLLAATPGRYAWTDLDIAYSFSYFTVRRDSDYSFDVKPGAINYPGDLVFRDGEAVGNWAGIRVTDRVNDTITLLQHDFPGLLDRFTLAYSGKFPDPYAGFLLGEMKASGGIAANVLPLPKATLPPPPALPISVEDFWRQQETQDLKISPDGSLIAQSVYKDDQYGIDMIDIVAGLSTRISTSGLKTQNMVWSGDGYLLVEVGSDDGPRAVTVFRIFRDAAGARKFQQYVVPKSGWLVDAPSRRPGFILFGSASTADSGPLAGEFMVHLVDVRSPESARNANLSARARLDKGVVGDRFWWADGNGELRLALAVVNKKEVLLHGSGSDFQPVYEWQDDQTFDPVGLSDDGATIYAITDIDRQQRELVAFDARSRAITKTLYSLPGTDVAGMLLRGESREPAGVTYYREGKLVSEYFESQSDELQARLDRTFPGMNVMIVDHDRSRQGLIVAVEASDKPLAYYWLDAARNHAEKLGDAEPWLSGKDFSPSRVVKATAADGLSIEAYLTLPKGKTGKSPLVVLPHGGPIGVRDARYFDSEVQFLASLGYAVLQVNFRGSEGFGRAFQRAGRRGFGGAIEDDIDQTLKQVLASEPVDGERMCLMGSSYGGYSALIELARWPGRFRCAISMMGVTDLPLLFSASDSSKSEQGRMFMKEYIGDPDADMAQLREHSPDYQYRKILEPVMLIQGEEDRRVEMEHERRMARLLTMAGRPPVVLEIADEGHGFQYLSSMKTAYEAVAAFLSQHLGSDPSGRNKP